MNTQKNDPSRKGQTAQGQDKKSDRNRNESVNKRPQQGQGEEEEGTKLPGREIRTPVAGKGGRERDSGKNRNAL